MNSLMVLRHSFSIFLKRNIPFLTTLFLIIFSLTPWQIAFISYFAVPLAYICLFYWTIFSVDLLTPLPVFVLGLCSDLLTTAPLGYNTFLFLLFYWVVLENRRFLVGRSFLFLWGCFCICCVGLAILQWMLASLLLLEWLSLLFFITQELLLVAMFPFIAAINTWFYLHYLDED